VGSRCDAGNHSAQGCRFGGWEKKNQTSEIEKRRVHFRSLGYRQENSDRLPRPRQSAAPRKRARKGDECTLRKEVRDKEAAMGLYMQRGARLDAKPDAML